MGEKIKKVIAQKSVIIKDDKFLVLLRSKDEKAYPALWDFPGGRLEVGEDKKESLIREVKEETHLDIQVTEELGIYFDRSQNLKEVKFIIYRAKILSREIKLSEEHEDYQWLTSEEIEKLDCMPFMKDFLNDF